MDKSQVEANHVKFLYYNYADNDDKQTFTASFKDCQFTPDYMKVHSIMYSPVAADDVGPYFIYSDIVSKDIGSFIVQANGVNKISSAMNTANIEYKLGNSVNGNFSFTCRISTVDGYHRTYNLGGYIVICLEFIKYKANKPEKVY